MYRPLKMCLLQLLILKEIKETT